MRKFRCPNCGGIPQHYIIDWIGRAFYKCREGLCRAGRAEGRRNYISPCNTVFLNGSIFHGTIYYYQGANDKKVTEVNI